MSWKVVQRETVDKKDVLWDLWFAAVQTVMHPSVVVLSATVLCIGAAVQSFLHPSVVVLSATVLCIGAAYL
jgi:hypothetical protein